MKISKNALIAPKGKDSDERFNLNREILGKSSGTKNPSITQCSAIEINMENINSVIDKIIKSKVTNKGLFSGAIEIRANQIVV